MKSKLRKSGEGGGSNKKRRGWMALYFVGRYCTSNEEKGVWEEKKGVGVWVEPPTPPPRAKYRLGRKKKRTAKDKRGPVGFFSLSLSCDQKPKRCQPTFHTTWDRPRNILKYILNG